MTPRGLEWRAVPEPIRDVGQALCDDGHAVWMVGEGLTAMLRTEPPASWALTTNAAPNQVADALAHAVPTRRASTAFAVPSAAGPVDVLPLRWGDTVEADLAHAGFRLLAMAWRWPDGELVDPHGGLDDLGTARLAAVGDPADALAEAPLRVWIAARLLAEHDLSLDPALGAALESADAERLAELPAMALRREVSSLLLAPAAGRGVDLLRSWGTDRTLGLRSDAGAGRRVDAMPRALEPRLLAWIAGQGGARLLGRLRFDPECRRRVGQLLQYHPVERRLGGARRAALRRALERLPAGAFEALATLREIQMAEADASEATTEARRALASLRQAVREVEEEAHRAARAPELIWQGGDVIRTLGIDPGPRVGEALRYLRDRVAHDGALNTPVALRGLLEEWHASRDSAAEGSSS